MTIVSVHIEKNGKSAASIHLGDVGANEAQRISDEIMAICYRKQRSEDFAFDTAIRIAYDPDTGADTLRAWLKSALVALRGRGGRA